MKSKKETRQTLEALSVSVAPPPDVVALVTLRRHAGAPVSRLAAGAQRCPHGGAAAINQLMDEQLWLIPPRRPSLVLSLRLWKTPKGAPAAQLTPVFPSVFSLLSTNVFPQALHAQTSGKFSRRL